MCPRRLAFAMVACCALAGPAAAAGWSPVPGAPQLEVQLASLRQAGTRVTAWLRWDGAAPLALPELAGAARARRTAVLAEFDCGARRMRALAASAYDTAGRPLAMTSTPGPLLPLQGADTAWAYDALCEAARAGRF